MSTQTIYLLREEISDLRQEVERLNKELQKSTEWTNILETKFNFQRIALADFIKHNPDSQITSDVLNKEIANYITKYGIFTEPWEVPRLLESLNFKFEGLELI